MISFTRYFTPIGVAFALNCSLAFSQVVAISDFSSNGRSLQRSQMGTYQGSLYFSVGIDNTSGRELWQFDGMNLDLVQGGFVGDSEISLNEFIEYRGELYFTGNEGTHGQELYRFDGNSVSLVADIQPGSDSSNPVGLTVYNDALYFSAQEGNSFNNLWKYDGTASRVASFNNPRASVVTGGIFNGEMYFGADDGVHGMELWKYDGSDVSMVADINTGITDSFPRDFTVAGDKMYFKATTQTQGQEIWQFDGNAASILTDTNPGALSSDPGFLTEVDGELYYSGVAWGNRWMFRTNNGGVEQVMDGGGPIDIGNGELAAIRGRRVNGVEVNDLYLQDGTLYRSTVPSAGSFTILDEDLYFGCACDRRELYRLARPGDADSNGVVDFGDFLVLSTHFGQSGNWLNGDFTNDGMISFTDFLTLSQNFGSVAVSRSTPYPVPEPAANCLLLLGLGAAVARWRRRES